MTLTLTPGSAAVLRALAQATDPVCHSEVDVRAARRLIRDGRLIRYASRPTGGVGARCCEPRYTLTPLGVQVAAALPPVTPHGPFTIHIHQEVTA